MGVWRMQKEAVVAYFMPLLRYFSGGLGRTRDILTSKPRLKLGTSRIRSRTTEHSRDDYELWKGKGLEGDCSNLSAGTVGLLPRNWSGGTEEKRRTSDNLQPAEIRIRYIYNTNMEHYATRIWSVLSLDETSLMLSDCNQVTHKVSS
jgi:hypothetical protein